MIELNRSRGLLVVCAFCVLAAGCNVEEVSNKTPLALECKPNQALLAQATSCVLDESCPCGSHCELGQCVSSCGSDWDCKDSACDVFGRCTRRPGEIPDINAAPTALLNVLPRRVTMRGAEPTTVSLDAVAHDSGRLRVSVGGPLEVSCDGVAFAASCTVENLQTQAANPVKVDVRRRDATDGFAGTVSVQVHAASGTFTVPVVVDPPQVSAPSVKAVACTAVAAGVYTGTARLVAIGSGAAGSTASRFDNALADVTLPVSARLYDSGAGAAGRVHFTDELGALFGPDGAHGDVSATGPTLLATRYLTGTGPASKLNYNFGGDGANLDEPLLTDVGVGFTPGQWTCSAQALGGHLDVAFLGLAQHNPFLRWEVQLVRAASLPAGVTPPALPAAWARSFPLNAEFAPLDPVFPTNPPHHPTKPGYQISGGAGFSTTRVASTRYPGCVSPEDCACGGTDPGVFDTSSAPGRTGDLGCVLDPDGQQQQRLFPLFNQPALVDLDVESCLADFADAAAGTDTGPTTCVATRRALWTLSQNLKESRRAALAPPGAPQVELDNKVSLRKLQQWLAVASFVARDADQVALRTRRLGKTANQSLFGVTPPNYTLTEAVLSSLQASGLVLHPIVAPALTGMQAEHLASPDYRPLAAPALVFDTQRTHDQNVGLPVSILRTQTAQLHTLQSLAQSVIWRQTPHRELTPVFSTALRTILPGLAMAHATRERASATGALTWQAEWDNAQTLEATALLEALERYGSARRGDNEFGIPVGELPLARIGDETGALSRFSALSDYLLGAPGSQLAVAPAMVERAQSKLAAARQSWVDGANRDLAQEYSTLGQQRRVADVAAKYGAPIASLCGDPTYNTGTVLDEVGVLNPDACFIKAECRPSFEEQKGRLTSSDLGYALCVHGYLRKRAGATAQSSGDPDFDRLADTMPDGSPLLEMLAVSPDGNGSLQVNVQWRGTTTAGTLFPRKQRLSFPMPLSWSRDISRNYGIRYFGSEDFTDADAACRPVWTEGERLRPWERDYQRDLTGLSRYACETAQQCPPGRFCRSNGTCESSAGQVQRETTRLTGDVCYQGGLGQSLLGIKAAHAAVTAATERLDDRQRFFENKMTECNKLIQLKDLIEGSKLRRDNTLDRLHKAKEKATFWSDVCGVVTGSLGGDFIDELFGDPKPTTSQGKGPPPPKSSKVGAAANGGLAVLSFGAAIGKVFAGQSVREIEAEIDAANAAFEEEVQGYKDKHEIFVCLNEAQRELIGSGEAAAEVDRASAEYRRAVAHMLDQKNELRRLVDEGRAALVAERSVRLPTLEGDFWLSQNISQYERALRQAKRAVFLAALAAEYELQVSSVVPDQALAADSAEELAQVVERLRGWTATGTISGANPTDLVAVVSVRDHLLKLGSRKGAGDGFYDLSEAARFRLLVTSRAFAVTGANGEYLGQELPFDLLPSSRSGVQDTSGISILSGEDCAERIWSVNASLIGSNLQTDRTNMTRITLRKNHSFFSQWCGSAGPDGSAFQQASSSRRNLFLDPESYAAADLPQTPAPVDPNRTYASARLQPRFNVLQSDLEAEDYVAGDSQELAGRGLYGSYSLFIPAESLALNGAQGLVLSQVEDVLLRFDYVSVAR